MPFTDPSTYIYFIASLILDFASLEKVGSIKSSRMNHVLNFTLPLHPMDPDKVDSKATAQAIWSVDMEISPANTATIICFIIPIIYGLIQYLVLGNLRVSERQQIRDTFWDYFTQKTAFIIFILDAATIEDRLPWSVWYTNLLCVLLLSRLCRFRFEYLSLSPQAKEWSLIKISLAMLLLLIITLCCNVLAFQESSSSQKLFLIADATYILTYVVSVITKFLILTYDNRTNSIWENRASVVYYGDLSFTMIMSLIDLLHHAHILVVNPSFCIRIWCVAKIHTLFSEIRRRYKKHKNYLLVVNLMEKNFSMATKDDIDKNSDYCAICWDEMESARKLPCGHLFHNSCLRSWLEQDTSCPKCRTSIKGPQDSFITETEDPSETEEEVFDTVRPHQRNHLFHFDTARYTNNQLLSWLPTISIEGFM